jgi:hypothetical protein
MFHTLHTPKVYEVLIKNFFTYYRNDILTLHRKQWSEESIRDKSCVQYKIQQYYLALYLVLLIKVEVDSGVNTTWQYYIDKYGLADKAKKFACNNISLKQILSIFGLPTSTTTETELDSIGINYDDISVEFVVGGEDSDTNNVVVDIQELFDLTDNCVNYLNGETTVFDMSTTSTGSSGSSTPSSLTIYYGANVNPSVNESDILTFDTITVTSLAQTITITDAGYKYIVIPVGLGFPSDFVDADSEFSLVMDSPIYIDVNGVPCYVYRSYYSLGGSININIEQ